VVEALCLALAKVAAVLAVGVDAAVLVAVMGLS